MNISLRHKVILVTGASRGIGAAIAQQLATSGATVAVHYRSQVDKAQQLANELGHDAKAFQADLENPDACGVLFREVIAHYGRVDVLINNAGIARSTSIESDRWADDFDAQIAVNLRATGVLCKEAIMHFKQHGGGRIINIASRAAFRGDTPEYMAYAASKGGVVALSRSIARGYGKDNIQCFTIAPGFVKTEMAQDFIDEYGEEFVINDLALNTLTTPKDLSPMITLLASGMADHATGCTIDINAGSYVH